MTKFVQLALALWGQLHICTSTGDPVPHWFDGSTRQFEDVITISPRTLNSGYACSVEHIHLTSHRRVINLIKGGERYSFTTLQADRRAAHVTQSTAAFYRRGTVGAWLIERLVGLVFSGT